MLAPMRMLGHTATLAAFRWDLVYLLAQLLSDERKGVPELAPAVQDFLQQIADQRAAFEQAEDEEIVAAALLNKKDKRRDAVIIEAGGIARASDKDVYKILFPRLNPSLTARLGIDEESAEVRRILGEVGKLAIDHPIRVAYEQELADVEKAVRDAAAQSEQAVTALALQRSQLDRFKLTVDQMRLTTHGSLVVVLKNKAEADAFYRPTSNAPGDAAGKDGKAPPPAAAPAAAAAASGGGGGGG